MKIINTLKTFFLGPNDFTLQATEPTKATVNVTREPLRYTDYLNVETRDEGAFLTWPDGSLFDGPYKRPADAKGQLTRLRKQELAAE